MPFEIRGVHCLSHTTEFPVISPPEPSLCSSAGGQGGFSAWLESALADWVLGGTRRDAQKFWARVGRSGCTLLGRIRREVCSDVIGVKKQRTLAPDPNPAWRLPVQQELDGLFGELAAFNERIAELVKHGHRSHAMTVLKVQALSLASQIDELRGLLAAPKRSRD
jgi:hypothetical protein